MKKICVIALCISILITGGCNRNDDLQQFAATRAMLLGKWQLDKSIEEYYKPVPVLQEREETSGTTGDTVIFKNDNLVYAYRTLSTGVEEEIFEYTLVNDSTVIIDDEAWRIRQLTAHELTLYQEETENDERDIRVGYFIR
ncbi:lipocalin family protein [Longitalea arenae]|uniref:lipocalin family protein n=1 Tax=Longitalea arenae TaxID=2812558 RepID=UPI001966D3F1|nr:lipocalin family protein [Longitalea arenae]